MLNYARFHMQMNVFHHGDATTDQLFACRSWTTKRRRVLARDGYQCQVCGDIDPLLYDGALFVHHIIHRAQRGTDDPNNLITLCDLCHGGVLHGYRKWLGFYNMSGEAQEDMKRTFPGTQEEYHWFVLLHLKDHNEFLRVQAQMWHEFGRVKSTRTR